VATFSSDDNAADPGVDSSDPADILAGDSSINPDIAKNPGDEFRRIVYGSKLDPLTIASLENLYSNDAAFQILRTKLGRSLTRILNQQNRVSIPGDHEVC
jgi:hypothetical protein